MIPDCGIRVGVNMELKKEKKPIIGILARPEVIYENLNIMYVFESSRNAIIHSGGIPMLILPSKQMVYYNNKEIALTDEDKEMLNAQVDVCDGILMPGRRKNILL